MKNKVPVSVIINTLNEEHNLPFAIRSVYTWVDEIVVCDMYSEDRTVEIAREYGAKVFLHERMGFADPARAYAIEQATNEWVLVLDADELIPKRMSEVIARLVAGDEADVYRLPRLNYLLGAPILNMGWSPDQDVQYRLFKKSAVRITADIHKFFHVRDDMREVRLCYSPGEAIVHFNYIDLSHFIEKLNRYASIEADQAHARGERASIAKAIAGALREWVSRYFRNGGWREGWRGFYLTAMMSMYRIAIHGKMTELETGNAETSVKRRYAEKADEYLAEYFGPPDAGAGE